MIEALPRTTRAVFYEEEHKYFWLDENGQETTRELRGVTGRLKEMLYPDEYADVPEDILENAKKRGTRVHNVCEMWDNLGIEDDCIELANYRELCKQLPPCIASEFLVSDNFKYASSIDKVFRHEDGTLILGDIKTTYKLNTEYVGWQLSVYAYFLLDEFPDLKIGDFYAIWLRGDKAKLVKVQKHTKAEVEWLLYSEVGTPFPKEAQSTEVRTIEDAELALAKRERELKRLKAEQDELKAKLLSLMKDNGIKKFDGKHLTISFRTGGTRSTFNSKLFKEESPEQYAKYCTESTTADSITIKLKD